VRFGRFRPELYGTLENLDRVRKVVFIPIGVAKLDIQLRAGRIALQFGLD
jgi:hypothetical protein